MGRDLGIDAVLPILLKQGFGHIVNTSSAAGIITPSYQAVYNTTKHAVIGLGESLRIELAHKGIVVTTLCPGYVATPALGETPFTVNTISPEEAARIILDAVEMKKGIVIFPEELDRWIRGAMCHPEEIDRHLFQDEEKRRKNLADRGLLD